MAFFKEKFTIQFFLPLPGNVLIFWYSIFIIIILISWLLSVRKMDKFYKVEFISSFLYYSYVLFFLVNLFHLMHGEFLCGYPLFLMCLYIYYFTFLFLYFLVLHSPSFLEDILFYLCFLFFLLMVWTWAMYGYIPANLYPLFLFFILFIAIFYLIFRMEKKDEFGAAVFEFYYVWFILNISCFFLIVTLQLDFFSIALSMIFFVPCIDLVGKILQLKNYEIKRLDFFRILKDKDAKHKKF